ncbi:hypothetical protein D1007_18922 [Hordeum vulgare]|nr:hypothetical protein D1007_18922 [Hordeum vulgare]
MDTTRAMTYPCSEFLAVTSIKDEFDNLCAAAGVRNVGKTTKMKVQLYELKSLFASLYSKDPRDIHRGKISSILFPHIRYFAYYIARAVLAHDNTSNISALDLAILAAALLGVNTYNIGALIARRLVANSGKGPHFGGIYATLILEHLKHTNTVDGPNPENYDSDHADSDSKDYDSYVGGPARPKNPYAPEAVEEDEYDEDGEQEPTDIKASEVGRRTILTPTEL